MLLVTIGVMISTYASLPKAPQKDDVESQATFWTWLLGLAILAVSLVFTGCATPTRAPRPPCEAG